ncbi:hypothetical protein JJJ17_06480 [Paracoccus caeni]|uniref:Uncharacterized protein n=1 Tax=Paracoccus caeni TaxID=657651 RepID=A0A934VZR4_9RHOB|nr:hypothetical protein [Paracoccus caeni]MBK4215568.1 hypothetical protein [Paracoccus caeni]
MNCPSLVWRNHDDQMHISGRYKIHGSEGRHPTSAMVYVDGEQVKEFGSVKAAKRWCERQDNPRRRWWPLAVLIAIAVIAWGWANG